MILLTSYDITIDYSQVLKELNVKADISEVKESVNPWGEIEHKQKDDHVGPYMASDSSVQIKHKYNIYTCDTIKKP